MSSIATGLVFHFCDTWMACLPKSASQSGGGRLDGRQSPEPQLEEIQHYSRVFFVDWGVVLVEFAYRLSIVLIYSSSLIGENGGWAWQVLLRGCKSAIDSGEEVENTTIYGWISRPVTLKVSGHYRSSGRPPFDLLFCRHKRSKCNGCGMISHWL